MADSCSHCIWSLRTGNSLWHWQAHICNSSSTISIVILHDLLARAYRGLCCQFREAINCVFPASTGPTDTIQTFSVCRDRFVHLLSEALPSSLILRVAFLIIFTFVSAGPILFQCNPVAAAWNFSLRAPPFGTGTAKCMDLNVFIKFGVFNSCTFLSLTKCMKHYLPFTAINALTDVLFAVLPVPMIWTLKINTRTKISLIGILSLGFL